MFKKYVALCLMTSLMVGCANEAGQVNKKNVGMATGAVSGALLGSLFGKGDGKIMAAVAGAAVGGFIGSSIGAQMDEADLAKQQQSMSYALENNTDGKTLPWLGKNSQGSVTPVKTYSSHGQYCREYQQQVTVGGKTERAYGRACRQPDGSWEIAS